MTQKNLMISPESMTWPMHSGEKGNISSVRLVDATELSLDRPVGVEKVCDAPPTLDDAGGDATGDLNNEDELVDC